MFSRNPRPPYGFCRLTGLPKTKAQPGLVLLLSEEARSDTSKDVSKPPALSDARSAEGRPVGPRPRLQVDRLEGHIGKGDLRNQSRSRSGRPSRGHLFAQAAGIMTHRTHDECLKHTLTKATKLWSRRASFWCSHAKTRKARKLRTLEPNQRQQRMCPTDQTHHQFPGTIGSSGGPLIPTPKRISQ